ncbi:MAG TPA: hypothetical protein VFC15_13460 [Candidatus Limnocylindrales bacterium]|nr:hypothetical protein [Candidatus Limnocylindrales bacterium]
MPSRLEAIEEFIPYTEHPELPRSYPVEAPIWTYFAFARFLALLKFQALHFTRVDRKPARHFSVNHVALGNPVGLISLCGENTERIAIDDRLIGSGRDENLMIVTLKSDKIRPSRILVPRNGGRAA